ncbi:MAG: 2Fe-2S iron-sulfur cluster-binding protein [Pseudomonadota bacterium]
MSKMSIALSVNGRPVQGELEPRTHLADFLREDLHLTGTHLGCEQGVCGACTVMIDGRPSRSCITLAAACDGADVRTIESFDDDALMARLRDAFTRHHGLQCGFCTPGLLATAYDVVRRVPDADRNRIQKEISGNLCRCTGYQGAVAAIEDVLANSPPEATLRALPRSQSTPRTTGASDDVASTPAMTAVTSDQGIPASISDGVRLSRSITMDGSADDVWKVLRDIPSVVRCVPGAQLDGETTGDVVRGHMAVSLGPMQPKFGGVGRVAFNDGGRSGRIIGRGSDRLSRSQLDGELNFALTESGPESSRVDLDIVYQLKGPLAQFGRPAVVEEVADRLLAQTAENIGVRAKGGEPDAQAAKAVGGFGLLWAALVGFWKGLFRRS